MPAAEAAPLLPAFPDLFSGLDFASRQTVMVAVSGGSDSLALLHLLNDHPSNGPTRMIAATVDHGLRPESAAEASQVADHCRTLGVDHRTLAWQGPKPSTGVQAAAREARFALLAQAALDAGTDLVLTGHTADDQAETVAMRRLRSPSGRGLAGIAPATLWRNRVWFARPLLDMRRDDLQAYLRARGVAWLSDPSNADRRFERARLRADGVSGHDALVAEADSAARSRRAASEAAAQLIDSHARLEDGGVRLAPDGFATHPAAVLALQLVLASLGGRTHLPEEEKVEALAARMAGGQPFRDTLAGVLVDRRRDHTVLSRERRRGVAPTGPASGPYAELLPSFDLEAARALARLFGAPDIPPPPFGHKER